MQSGGILKGGANHQGAGEGAAHDGEGARLLSKDGRDGQPEEGEGRGEEDHKDVSREKGEPPEWKKKDGGRGSGGTHGREGGREGGQRGIVKRRKGKEGDPFTFFILEGKKVAGRTLPSTTGDMMGDERQARRAGLWGTRDGGHTLHQYKCRKRQVLYSPFL